MIETGIDPESLAATLYRAGGGSSDPGLAEPAFANVYKRIREISYDVVHNHAFDVPAITLAGTVGQPVVHTLHLPPDKSVVAALHQAARHPIPPAIAGVSKCQADAWRVFVQVDAILRPHVSTVHIPWSTSAGNGVVFAGRFTR
jgi:hypothetical protein